MVKIIDTYPQILSLYENENFCLDKWEEYINSIYENAACIFKDDIEEYFEDGRYTFEKDFLPIINAVNKSSALDALHQSFVEVTRDLNTRIVECFGKELDVDIVLYLGLCNAAGWVTNINGRDTVLLGVEKIIELNWIDKDFMYGLIYHELGHVYHKQYGTFHQHCEDNKKNFVWQLFTEGIAMYFEQVLVKDKNYFHQDEGGWKEWCDNHFRQIMRDFDQDLPTMTKATQRYFGDWANYYGHADAGYYLGTKFIHYLIARRDFVSLINLNVDDVYKRYLEFVQVHEESSCWNKFV